MIEIKEGDEVEAQFGCYGVNKGDIRKILEIVPCESRGGSNTCRKCPGRVRVTEQHEADCFGYQKGYVWKIAKVSNWKRRLTK